MKKTNYRIKEKIRSQFYPVECNLGGNTTYSRSNVQNQSTRSQDRNPHMLGMASHSESTRCSTLITSDIISFQLVPFEV